MARIRNTSQAMKVFNLPEGKTLVLPRGEDSRELTPEEMDSMEVRKALKARAVVKRPTGAK